MDILLFLAGIFLLTIILGFILEKFHIPWIFGSLLVGLGLAIYNPFNAITSSNTFSFLSNLGLYFLLFIIGFELDISKFKESSKFIVKLTSIIFLSEMIVGGILVHVIFHLNWFISFLVSSSFATVGEAVLYPILDKFKLVKTKLGQSILGVGALDDIFEIITIVVASFLISNSGGHSSESIRLNILLLISLFGLAWILMKLRDNLRSFKYKDISSLFLFLIFTLFVFIGIGDYVDSGALGALLAGLSLRNIVPDKTLKFIESEIKTVAYGLFAPIFFVSVGAELDFSYFITSPLIILVIMLLTSTTKIFSSILVGKKELGIKKSFVMGISLCVKFSTSVVVLKLLYTNGLVPLSVYSALIGATILSQYLIPLVMSYLIKFWHISGNKVE